jgi:hypothetical protein
VFARAGDFLERCGQPLMRSVNLAVGILGQPAPMLHDVGDLLLEDLVDREHQPVKVSLPRLDLPRDLLGRRIRQALGEQRVGVVSRELGPFSFGALHCSLSAR